MRIIISICCAVLNGNKKKVDIKAGEKEILVWTGKIESGNSPWFAVVVPDDDLKFRKEVKLKSK